jgi:hypothetical protein
VRQLKAPDTHQAQLKYGRGKKIAGKIALTQKRNEEEVKKSRLKDLLLGQRSPIALRLKNAARRTHPGCDKDSARESESDTPHVQSKLSISANSSGS